MTSVHCRTGSLEINACMANACDVVHCRTGSLESHLKRLCVLSGVHCRTGSLEINKHSIAKAV